MREYANAIQSCLAARAIWEPGVAVVPGDYGQILDAVLCGLGRHPTSELSSVRTR